LCHARSADEYSAGFAFGEASGEGFAFVGFVHLLRGANFIVGHPHMANFSPGRRIFRMLG
jgi:hypothetical protein